MASLHVRVREPSLRREAYLPLPVPALNVSRLRGLLALASLRYQYPYLNRPRNKYFLRAQRTRLLFIMCSKYLLSVTEQA
jgi:hypothetical protein